MVVVFGSLNMDMVMKTPELPRPGNTILCPNYETIPGGKGANQAAASGLTGQKTLMVGSIGNDVFGEQLLKSLKACGVNTDTIQKVDQPTGCATICVDPEGENVIVVASGANSKTTKECLPQEYLRPGNVMLTQCETPLEETWAVIKQAKERGATTILNLAPARKVPEDVLKSLDYLIMNEIEVTILGLHLGFEAVSPTIAARHITGHYGITCVITLGSEGAFASSPTGEWEVPPLQIDPVDTTAAGDTFSGVFAAEIEKGLSLEKALRYATVAGGLCCTKFGAQTSLPSLDQIEEALQNLKPLKRIK